MTPSWNTRKIPSLFFNYIFYVTLIMMMMMFNAQCTKHSCTCPIFFVHPPDQSTFTTGPPHPAWKTLCPYGVGKIYVLKGTNMFLDSFQRNTIQFRGNSYLFRNFSWQAPIFRSLSQRVATLFPKIILSSPRAKGAARRACALRALGLLLTDSAPTVGRGKTFGRVN